MAGQFITIWTDIDAQIADVLNAAATWSGAITAGNRSAAAIALARHQTCLEILRAISGNTNHPTWGDLAQYLDVVSGAFLPAHDGEVGIPIIVPYFGATPRKGMPATPDQIDSWRAETAANPIYTGGIDGVGVPHNSQDAQGRMSALACRYAIVNKVFDFTGYGAQIPMIIITDVMADTKIPIALAPAVTKCAIPKLVKPGDNVYQIADKYGSLGQKDLAEIAAGAVKVSPVPTIAQVQKLL